MSEITFSDIGVADIDELLPLFLGYRVFYKRESCPRKAAPI